MNRCATLGLFSTATVLLLAGCQTWGPSTFPLQNASRVPPPGTGSYQAPNGYYGNQAPPTGQTMMPSTSAASFAGGQLPATNLSTQNGNSVVAAQYTAPNEQGAWDNTVSSASFSSANPDFQSSSNLPSTGPTSSGSVNFSDHDVSLEAPSLQWQQ